MAYTSLATHQTEYVDRFAEALAGYDLYAGTAVRHEAIETEVRQYLGLASPSRIAVMATVAFAEDWYGLYAIPRMNVKPPGDKVLRHQITYDEIRADIGDSPGKTVWYKHWSLVLWRDSTEGIVYPAHFQEMTTQLDRPRILPAATELTRLVGGLLLFRELPINGKDRLQVIDQGQIKLCDKLDQPE